MHVTCVKNTEKLAVILPIKYTSLKEKPVDELARAVLRFKRLLLHDSVKRYPLNPAIISRRRRGPAYFTLHAAKSRRWQYLTSRKVLNFRWCAVAPNSFSPRVISRMS